MPGHSKPADKSGVFCLVVSLDADSRRLLEQVAALRQINVSDYVRMVSVAQARMDVELDHANGLALSPEEQLAFWQALQGSAALTSQQQRLGKMMQGSDRLR